LEIRSGINWLAAATGAGIDTNGSVFKADTLAELKENCDMLIRCQQSRVLPGREEVEEEEANEPDREPQKTIHEFKRIHVDNFESDGQRIVPFFLPSVVENIKRIGFNHTGMGDAWRQLGAYPTSLLLHIHSALFESITHGLGTVQVQALTDDITLLTQRMMSEVSADFGLLIPAGVLQLQWTVLDMNRLIGSAGTFPSMQSDYVIVFGDTIRVTSLLCSMKNKFTAIGLADSVDLLVRVWVVRTDDAPFRLADWLSQQEIAKFHVQEVVLREALMMAAFYHCTLFSPDRSALYMYGVKEALAFMKALREKAT
jgi:hypothetical protein